MVGDVFRKDEIDATHYPVWREINTLERTFNTLSYYSRMDTMGQFMIAVPYDPIILSANLITDQSFSPINAAKVELYAGDVLLNVRYTDEAGYLQLWVPSGIPIRLEFRNECGDILYEVTDTDTGAALMSDFARTAEKPA